MPKANRLLYSLRFLVMLVWSLFLLLFWILLRLRLLAWLAVLPVWLASVALRLASHTEIMVLICVALGASSLLLWRWLPAPQATSLAVLVPMLLAVGSLLCGRIDMQGTEAYVLEPARRGDVRQSREQLLIKMVQSGLTAELQALIQVGTDVNARDPGGDAALYRAREPELVKPLLQAGAKPDGKALLEAAFWGRTDAVKLLLAATPDDGKALVAEVGEQALQAAKDTRASGEQDRGQIVQMLLARGAKPLSAPNSHRRR